MWSHPKNQYVRHIIPPPLPVSRWPGLTVAFQQLDPAVPDPCPTWPSGLHSPDAAARTRSVGQIGRWVGVKRRHVPRKAHRRLEQQSALAGPDTVSP